MERSIYSKFLFVLVFFISVNLSAQHGSHGAHSGHDHSGHSHGAHGHHHDDHHGAHGGHKMICGEDASHKFNVTETAMHHIGDANVYSIGPLQIPLPAILYSKDAGLQMFSSSKFKPALLGHGDGTVAYNDYVLKGGRIYRLSDRSFPDGEVAISGFLYSENKEEKKVQHYVCDGTKKWKIEPASTADFGVFGGGLTSFYDFSLTKNVVSMILVTLFLSFVFLSVASAYKKREGKAPKGLQSFMEPLVLFVRDEVAQPFIGHKWGKYFPFLLAVFFFILGLNLFGQIPFLGGSNVTGNLAVTLVLAVIAFLITNISGNAHYWKHQLTAPGVPWFVKIILVPVEIMGMFIKPLTLMLRLFANITAGHIVMVVFISLIFIFGKEGASPGGAYGASIGSAVLTMFMMALELIVSFVQAFVFTMLTASYIGAAVEEEHH